VELRGHRSGGYTYCIDMGAYIHNLHEILFQCQQLPNLETLGLYLKTIKMSIVRTNILLRSINWCTASPCGFCFVYGSRRQVVGISNYVASNDREWFVGRGCGKLQSWPT
jgi:hypothetical protein